MNVASQCGINLLPRERAADEPQRQADKPAANNPDCNRAQDFQPDSGQHRRYGLRYGGEIGIHNPPVAAPGATDPGDLLPAEHAPSWAHLVRSIELSEFADDELDPGSSVNRTDRLPNDS